ncbi:lysophospholipid acyltransferase family protein [Rhodococcus sp. (in: high G+C Gram-positive bacteria)]|uniref:lysophospholipid acyltransferase family protein n=1 Tax=Rhodococcus sp. TaxID=1831 RepID=UPI003890E1F8
MTQVAKVIPLHAGSRRPAGGGTHRTVTPGPPEGKASEEKQSLDTGGLLDDFRDALIAQVIGTAEFVRRRMTGDYEVDDFGFDPHFADNVVQPVLRPLFEKWFRVEVRGAENIPTDGRALVVANHAGTLPLDALMTSVAVRERAGRPLRMLAADLAFDLPVVGTVARKAGHTLACHPDAERLLREDQVVAVFPEGYKGLGKPFKERYKLQRFGRGGFVSAALKTHAPIVPCSIVGSEEIYPNLADLSSLARLLGLPYFPVTPLFPALGPLGIIPLPSKWYIEFGTPIDTDVYDEVAADDPMVLFEVTDHVRETIQQTLYKLLTRRRNVFLG